MKLWAFSSRTTKEIVRDPLNLGFGLAFPLVLLVLLTAIQSNIPVKVFVIEDLAPGITIFGLTFMTLFSATLIARDRESAFLQRLYTTPLGATDFILGYALPIVPIAMVQGLLCYLAALLLQLPLSMNIVYAVISIAPVSLFFIALGLLCGSVLNVKQVGGICGALLTNLAAWLSGIWFDLDIVGGAFKQVAYMLPFVHAVEIEKGLISGDYTDMGIHAMWVVGYALITVIIAVFVFLRQMKRQ